MTDKQTIPFSTVLASTVHDMKNSLSLILNSLQEITQQLKKIDPESNQVAVLQYQATRLNGLLVQLLALYKAEQKQLPLNINYQDVFDFIEEQVIAHEELLENKNIDVSFDVEDELEWAFDSELMATVINNVITNNIRYTKSRIHLEASIVDAMLEIRIMDDGPGYPEAMLNNQNDVILGINQSTGSTGLGLYFAGQVASMHNRNNIEGTIHLSNSAESGGIFTIRIP